MSFAVNFMSFLDVKKFEDWSPFDIVRAEIK